MTMPHLMNCPHTGEGWCLDCVQALQSDADRLEVFVLQLIQGRCSGPSCSPVVRQAREYLQTRRKARHSHTRLVWRPTGQPTELLFLSQPEKEMLQREITQRLDAQRASPPRGVAANQIVADDYQLPKCSGCGGIIYSDTTRHLFPKDFVQEGPDHMPAGWCGGIGCVPGPIGPSGATGPVEHIPSAEAQLAAKHGVPAGPSQSLWPQIPPELLRDDLDDQTKREILQNGWADTVQAGGSDENAQH